jgi:hypothetical protein
MAKRLVFLQLAPEFGSTKFGPFAAPEIRLGSDPSRNDIVLPEALGIAPEHARLVKQPDESFILAPVDRTSQVYLYRADGRPPKQVTSPIAVAGGDGFSLVSQEGPRFIIVLELPKQVAAQEAGNPALDKAKKRLSAKSFSEEIRRQGLARALATGAGQQVSGAWQFVKAGGLFRPRFIFGALVILSGWIFAGGIACSLAGVGLHDRSQAGTLERCQEDLSDALGKSNEGGGDPTINTLTAKVLSSKTIGLPVEDWNNVLGADQVLRAAYIKRLKFIKMNPDRYSWVWRRSGDTTNPYLPFRRRLDKKIDARLARVLSYIAVSEGEDKTSEWKVVLDSNEQDSCGRGPLRMTWRQAKHLNMDGLQLDAPMDPALVGQGGEADWTGAITKTATSIGETFVPEGVTINSTDGAAEAGRQCIFVEGEDYRTDVAQLGTLFQKELDIKAKNMPTETDRFWTATRLMKYFAADLDRTSYADIKYPSGKFPSVILEGVTLKATQSAYIINNMADVMARAALIPCLALQYPDPEKPAPPEIIGDQPTKMQCAIFMFLVDEESG